jgi:hypothetical protein
MCLFDDFQDTYTMYVLESLTVGESVVTMTAEDVDRNALLEYDIIEPISARDKTGNSLTNRVKICFHKKNLLSFNCKIYVNKILVAL